jgi:hypothetical protein
VAFLAQLEKQVTAENQHRDALTTEDTKVTEEKPRAKPGSSQDCGCG